MSVDCSDGSSASTRETKADTSFGNQHIRKNSSQDVLHGLDYNDSSGFNEYNDETNSLALRIRPHIKTTSLYSDSTKSKNDPIKTPVILNNNRDSTESKKVTEKSDDQLPVTKLSFLKRKPLVRQQISNEIKDDKSLSETISVNPVIQHTTAADKRRRRDAQGEYALPKPLRRYRKLIEPDIDSSDSSSQLDQTEDVQTNIIKKEAQLTVSACTPSTVASSFIDGSVFTLPSPLCTSDSYKYNIWTTKGLQGGTTPLLFRGNKSKRDGSCVPSIYKTDREDVLPSYDNLTDSLLKLEDETSWRYKMIEDVESGFEYETSTRDIDREWYDNEESNFFQHEGVRAEDASLRSKEAFLLRKQRQLREYKRSQKVNLRESIRNADQDLWEMNRLRQSGMQVSISPYQPGHEIRPATYYQLPCGDSDVDAGAHVIVKEVRPSFLDGSITYTSQIDTVPTIKDSTSDMAILSKRGSAVVKRIREQEDRTKMRQRFWEVSSGTMGKLIGVAAEKTKEEIEADKEALESSKKDDIDYKKDSMFGKTLNNNKNCAVSEFAKNRTLNEQRRSLPIYEVKEELLALLREHQIIVVVGNTGSGKTTQLTQYLNEVGYTKNGVIGCTQPRRVAAVSVAKRVSDEMDVELGTKVGYAIRFEDCTSAHTIITYMTDGILLRESLTDPDLERYSVIIMDEAHERSLNTDVLFGILKGVVSRRRDFRLIVTSATMNSEKFSQFFGSCPVFDILGRTFPVRIEYTRTPVEDYVDAAVQRCLQIHCSLSVSGGPDEQDAEGDVLIFMTGQEDIEATCYLITDKISKLGDKIPPLNVLPIYSTMPSDLQAKIFQKSKYRKVIVATNIAETSLTVDGIRFVIDCGYSKLKVYNPKIGMDSLQVTPISQANALQRSGRAGRTGPGVCYRLYTERAFVAELFENNIPEIQRTNLSHTVLLLKSLGIKNLLEFDFMDPPPQQTILNSMYQLWVLGALDDQGELTPTGSKMIQFPLDPPLAKMLLTAERLGCTAEILVIVSMISVPSVYYRPKDRAEESDAAREKFFATESDHLTLLNTFYQWKRNQYSPQWAAAHFLHQKAMKKAREVRAQLLDIMHQQKIEHVASSPDWDIVRKAICSGYFHNASKIRGVAEYVNLRTSIPCHVHPSSAIFGSGSTPEYVVYHEVVLTTKEYMQMVTAVEPEWLAELGPMFFSLRKDGGNDSY